MSPRDQAQAVRLAAGTLYSEPALWPLSSMYEFCLHVMSRHHMYAMLEEARKRVRNPETHVRGDSCALLGTKPGSSGGVASALNHEASFQS